MLPWCQITTPPPPQNAPFSVSHPSEHFSWREVGGASIRPPRSSPPSLHHQLAVLARSLWSIPDLPPIDADQNLNPSASACSTFLTEVCNYEIWASLRPLQPDGVSILQRPNEIKPSLMEAGETEGHLLQGNHILDKKRRGCPGGEANI